MNIKALGLILITITSLFMMTASCTSTPTPAIRISPQDQEEIRKRKVEQECAIYPERCQDWDLHDDSNLPDDPCRDYGDCDFIGSSPGYEGSGFSSENTGCPYGCTYHKTGCDIKGNISIDTGEKIYHVPGQEYYNETIIRTEHGERWFCTEQEARTNGWRKARK